MNQPKPLPVAFAVTWQRLVASLLVVAGMAVLGYGLVRPRVSSYIGERVSEQISSDTAREVVAVLVGEVAGAPPAADAPAAQASAALPAEPVAQASAAPADPGPGAPAPVATDAAVVAAPPVAAPAPVDGGSLLRAVAAPATAAPAEEAAQPTQGVAAGSDAPPQADAAPAPTRASGNALPTAAVGGSAPIVAPPISSPNPGRSIEEVVAALPSGEITVTAEKLNSRIAARAGALGPIEQLAVRFVPGEVQVTITVLGQDTVGRSGLAAVDGRVAAQSPSISGALGALISVDDLVRPVEEELNSILNDSGRKVTGVRIEQDQIVVTLE
jgi:hypothetical protein